MNILFLAILSFTVSICLTYCIIRISLDRHIGIDGHCNVPRIGGLAFIVTVLIMSFIIFNLNEKLFCALAAAICIAVAGLLDDLGYGFGATFKFSISLIAAVFAIFTTDIYVAHINTPILNIMFEYKPFAILISILALSGMCHGLNLIDGVHGLLLIFSIITFSALAKIAFDVDSTGIATLAICVVTTSIGLLIFNFPNGSIHMGDVGAYFVGFIAAWIAIYLCNEHQNVSPWSMICIFAYPIVDVTYAAARRLLAGQNPMKGDRQHLHHRFLRLANGLQPTKYCTAVIIATLSCSAMALVPSVLAAILFDEPTKLIILTACSFTTFIFTNWALRNYDANPI